MKSVKKNGRKVVKKCPFSDRFLADYARDLSQRFLGPGKSLKIPENQEKQ